MDSLLANYASSDEEEEKQENHLQTSLSSIKPTSSYSVPNPNSKPLIYQDDDGPKKPSLFSSIPKPKTQSQQQKPTSDFIKPPKRVVQFKPPINPSYVKPTDFDDDDEDDEKDRKRRKESESSSQSSSSVKSFLSSIPAPKNSSLLGALPSASGSGRKSVIGFETTPANSTSGTNNDQIKDSGDFVNHGGYESGMSNIDNQEMDQYGSSGYESHYGDYYYDGQHNGSNWNDGSTTGPPEIAVGPSESSNLMTLGKKRGKNEIPTEIIEVNQSELTKNRPREDQAKLTGIAFGPSYQPASTKGKPTKLHKRKHQIGSLYFDMKQKEMELAERRAKGFLTKAQTQAKYGW